MCRMIGIGWWADSSISYQDGENGPQLRSRLVRILNVALRLRLRF